MTLPAHVLVEARRGWLAVRAAWWALDWCRYWLTPAVIRRHLTDRGY